MFALLALTQKTVKIRSHLNGKKFHNDTLYGKAVWPCSKIVDKKNSVFLYQHTITELLKMDEQK